MRHGDDIRQVLQMTTLQLLRSRLGTCFVQMNCVGTKVESSVVDGVCCRFTA